MALVSFGTPAATQPIDTSTESREIKVILSTASFGWWAYEGTRAQLEAEGVIPPGTQWPQGKRRAHWHAGGLRFWLSRTRPEGLKGPMSAWVSGDWWLLRCEAPDEGNPTNWRIRNLEKALAHEIRESSPAAHEARKVQWSRYWAARKDDAFQAFKALTVPARKKPGRPSVGRTGGKDA